MPFLKLYFFHQKQRATMQAYIKKLNTVIQLTGVQNAWLLPIYILSGILRLSLLTLPFRWIAPFIGHPHDNTGLSVLASDKQEQKARQLGAIIRAVSRYTPWQSKCLVQALLARIILEFHHIPHVIFFGVCKSENDKEELKAHAWVNVNRCFVTGDNGHKSFTIVSSFVSEKAICDPGSK